MVEFFVVAAARRANRARQLLAMLTGSSGNRAAYDRIRREMIETHPSRLPPHSRSDHRTGAHRMTRSHKWPVVRAPPERLEPLRRRRSRFSKGTVICVQTDQKRYAALTVSSISP